jgi:sec-independent protein translocase protein TatA
MFDPKMLLIVLVVMLVIFGTKRLRTIGSDLGAAMKGFKQAVAEGEDSEKPAKQDASAVLDSPVVARDGEVKTTKNTA